MTQGPAASGIGYAGQRGVSDDTSRFNMTWFLVRQTLALIRTATLVQVQSCTNDGALAAVGSVDVLPLVNLTDGLGNPSKHGIVHGLPYFRVQGGTNAVICDPVAGDIGLAIFADRDISSVKANKKQSNPGSRRRFSWSDGIYIGGVLNAEPVQYVRFSADGIDIVDKSANEILMRSAGITINGVLFDRSQSISNAHNINGNGEVTFNGITLTTHVHTGVQTGGGNTGGPTG